MIQAILQCRKKFQIAKLSKITKLYKEFVNYYTIDILQD